jgi:hypothetical protein
MDIKTDFGHARNTTKRRLIGSNFFGRFLKAFPHLRLSFVILAVFAAMMLLTLYRH